MLEYHVVVHGHVAGSLIGYVYVVPLGGQTDERTAHRNHIVIRVRGEDENRLGEGFGRYGARGIIGIGLTAGPSGDGVLEVVENVYVDLVKLAHLFQQFAEAVVQIVLFRQLEDGLAGYLAKPDHGLADELGRPVAGAHQPGSYAAGELLGGGLIYVEGDVVVILEQGSRAVGGAGAFGNGLHGRGLVFTPGHQDNLFGREHSADTHRDGLVRRGHDVHIEVGRLALAGVVGEAYGAGAGFLIGAGLVEAHLALFAHANHQQVQVAGQRVKLGAVFSQFLRGNGAVRDVDVFLEDVYLVQQALVQTVVAALGTTGRRRIIFIDGDYLHVLERDFTGLVAAGQFIVQGHGSGSCGESQTEQTVFVCLDSVTDNVGNGVGSRAGFRINVGPDFLVGVENSSRQVLVDEPAFVR